MLSVIVFAQAGLPMRMHYNKNAAPTEADRENEKLGNSAFIRLLLCMVLMLAACGDKPAALPAVVKPQISGAVVSFAAESPQLAVLALAPVAVLAESGVELTARLVWDENRTVRIYAPFAGRVLRITAQPGEQVKAGHVLAYVGAPDFGQAQADAGRAVADFALSEKNLARVTELLENGVAPRKDLAQAEAEHARAKGELARAQGRVRLYGGGAGIDQTLALKSPIAGIVVERNLNPGQEVRPDQGGMAALFVVTDPARLWVQIDAHEKDLPLLAPGMAFKFKVPTYPGELFDAKLDVVADFIDPQSRVIRARGSAANDDRRLKGEMLVNAVFAPKGGPGLGVPARAVIFSEGAHFAFVERARGSFERVKVVPGGERGGQLAILSGLTSGQRVVSEGALLLQQVMKAGSSKTESE